MLIKTRGIVFRSVKYSETSFITDIYTEEKGLRSYIISGVRKKKPLVRASLLQLMSLVEMVAYHRDDNRLCRVKEIKAAEVYQSIPFDVRKGAVGMFMIEVVQKTIKESEENKPLFEFLYHSFHFLDTTDHPVSNFHLVFLLELSAYLGFLPGGRADEKTPYFNLREGVFSESQDQGLWFLDREESHLLSQLLYSSLEESHLVQMNREERRNILRHLITFYRTHVEDMPVINSYQVLEDVLG